MRVAILVEYDGTEYGGWQIQNNAETVQGKLEKALEELGQGRIAVHGAGRTDSGVHARGQCAHFDIETKIPAERFEFVLNSKLPPDIRVRKSWQADDDFHARFSAKGKRYVYCIFNAPHASALLARTTMHVFEVLDVEKMRRAAEYFVGEHDFKAFMASGSSVKTTVRQIYKAEITKENELIRIIFEGNGFLYNMVRIMTGTLIEVGKGKRTPESIEALLNGAQRKSAGMTADAKGLVMDEVFY